MQDKTLINELASQIDAYMHCQKTGNVEWEAKHKAKIDEYVEALPSGCGIDNGTKLLIDDCKDNLLVLQVGYHHMDDAGGYDGWTEHIVKARPSFIHGIELSISGRDRNAIKEYLYDVYRSALTQTVYATA